MTEREMLAIVCNFIQTKEIVQGDKDSIRDMVTRYKSPPFTMAFPVCIRLSIQQTNELNEILKQAYILLASTEVTPLATPTVEIQHDKTPIPSEEWLKEDYDKNLKGNWDDGNQ